MLLLKFIMSYQPIYKLLDWIPIEKLSKRELSMEPKAVDVLRKNPKYINWKLIGGNENAIPIIEDYIQKIDFNWLSGNENAIHLLKKCKKKRIDWSELCLNINGVPLIKSNFERICWHSLSGNENESAIEILQDNLDKIDWDVLSSNPSALCIIEKNLEKIDWSILSRNENAVHLLEANQDKICFGNLCYNPSPKVVPLILNNMSKIENYLDGYCSRNEPEILSYIEKNFNENIQDWNNIASICRNKDAFYIIEKNLKQLVEKEGDFFWMLISENENAMELLERNKDKICWKRLSSNSGIFKLDLLAMKNQCSPFAEELAAYVFSPNRINRFCEKYDMDFYSYMEIFI